MTTKGSKILDVVVKKEWFDLILSEEKKSEYREVKPFWTKKMAKKYDFIRVSNGYKKDRPSMIIEFKGVSVVKDINITYSNGSKLNWKGEFFDIKLGDIVEKHNIQEPSKEEVKEVVEEETYKFDAEAHNKWVKEMQKENKKWRADLDKALKNVFTDELVAKLDKEHGELLRSIIILPTQERGRKKKK